MTAQQLVVFTRRCYIWWTLANASHPPATRTHDGRRNVSAAATTLSYLYALALAASQPLLRSVCAAWLHLTRLSHGRSRCTQEVEVEQKAPAPKRERSKLSQKLEGATVEVGNLPAASVGGLMRYDEDKLRQTITQQTARYELAKGKVIQLAYSLRNLNQALERKLSPVSTEPRRKRASPSAKSSKPLKKAKTVAFEAAEAEESGGEPAKAPKSKKPSAFKKSAPPSKRARKVVVEADEEEEGTGSEKEPPAKTGKKAAKAKEEAEDEAEDDDEEEEDEDEEDESEDDDEEESGEE